MLYFGCASAIVTLDFMFRPKCWNKNHMAATHSHLSQKTKKKYLKKRKKAIVWHRRKIVYTLFRFFFLSIYGFLCTICTCTYASEHVWKYVVWEFLRLKRNFCFRYAFHTSKMSVKNTQQQSFMAQKPERKQKCLVYCIGCIWLCWWVRVLVMSMQHMNKTTLWLDCELNAVAFICSFEMEIWPCVRNDKRHWVIERMTMHIVNR